MNENLCTVQQVKESAPISQGYSARDAQIKEMIAVASGQVRAFCRRQFTLGTYTEYFMTPDTSFAGHRFRVKEWPILADTLEFSYDTLGAFAGENYDVWEEDVGYSIDLDEGYITLLQGTEYSRRGVRITYQGGYASDAQSPPTLQVPANISSATALQAAFLLQRQVAGQQGMEEQQKARSSMQKFTTDATTGLIGEVKSALSLYRNILVGNT